MRSFRNGLLAVVMVLANGCALMYNPNPQAVPVDSVPAGAAVFVDGEFKGMTPVELALDNREAVTLMLRLPDGREREFVLERRVDGVSVAVSLVPVAVVGGGLLYGEWRMNNATHTAEWLVTGAITVVGVVVGAGVSAFAIGLDAATGRWYRLFPHDVVVVFDD